MVSILLWSVEAGPLNWRSKSDAISNVVAAVIGVARGLVLGSDGCGWFKSLSFFFRVFDFAFVLLLL